MVTKSFELHDQTHCADGQEGARPIVYFEEVES